MNGFSTILRDLVDGVPGAAGAVFADWEGESVGEYAPELPSLEIRIIGAQWGLVWTALHGALDRSLAGAPEELVVRGQRGLVLVQRVTPEYYVVLTIGPAGHLATARLALRESAARLRAEM